MNRTLTAHLYGLWLPMPVFSMHLPSISDEPDGNDADDDDDEADVAFLKNKRTVCPGERLVCMCCTDTCLQKLQHAK